MGAAAVLDPKTLTVNPGEEVVATIRVKNTGTVVDQFTLGVLGDAGTWATADPPTLSLFPGAEETAKVTFRPPRSPEVPAGEMPFGVRVDSREDPVGDVVEEGVLNIGVFVDTFAEIVPRTSRGSRSASHDIAVDNRGNTRLNAQIVASDADSALDFDIRPPGIVAEPGTAQIAKVGVKPRKRFWRGPAKTHPFRVEVLSPDAKPVGVDGTMLQEAMLPPWALKAALAALALALIAVLAWVFFLKPAIESTAREQMIAAGASLDPSGNPVIPGGNGGGNGNGNGEPTPTPDGNGNGNGNGSGTPTPTNGNGTGGTTPGGVITPSPSPTASGLIGGGGPATPMDGRLLGDLSPDAQPVESGKTLYVTDLVFSNPSDTITGEIQLGRGEAPAPGTPLLVLHLENFRDIDFHFVTPIVIPGGQQLTLSCPTGCAGAAVYWSGYQR